MFLTPPYFIPYCLLLVNIGRSTSYQSIFNGAYNALHDADWNFYFAVIDQVFFAKTDQVPFHTYPHDFDLIFLHVVINIDESYWWIWTTIRKDFVLQCKIIVQCYSLIYNMVMKLKIQISQNESGVTWAVFA